MKVKIEINSEEFYDPAKIVNFTEVRNTIIRSFWEGLKYSNLPYKDRRNIVCKKFFMSENLVDRIITRNC